MTSLVLEIPGELEASYPAQHPEVHQGRKQPVSPDMFIWMMLVGLISLFWGDPPHL